MAVITSNLGLDLAISIFALVLSLYLYIAKNSNYWKNRSHIFGNVAPCIFAKKTPDELIREVYDKGAGEKLIGFYFFDKPYLLIRDPELIRNVFIKDFSNFSNKIMGGKHTDAMSSTNLFLANNPPWKYIRLKLAPIFTSGKLKKMHELMIAICDDLQVHLDKLDIDGTRLGYIQTKLGILNFVSKYKLTTCKATNVQLDKLNVFTHTKGGIYLNLRKLAA